MNINLQFSTGTHAAFPNGEPPPDQSEEVASALAKASEAHAKLSRRRRNFDEALLNGICPHCAGSLRQRQRFLRDDIFDCRSCGRTMETVGEFANKSLGD